MLTGLLSAWAWLNHHALAIFGAGLVVVALFNLWQWRADRARALQIRARPIAPIHLKATPRVTILAAAWNEAGHIAAHLQSVCALRYPNKEYILCAGGPDGTYALACRQAADWMKVLEQQPGEGKQRALRRCWMHATGEVVFLTDTDCMMNNDAFVRTLAPVINNEAEAATGRFAPLAEQQTHPFARMQWCVDNYGRTFSGPYIEGLIGRNAALTRRVIEQTGGFSADVLIGTDYYLARQVVAAGEQIRYVHASIIETQYALSVRAYVRQQSRWLRNILQHGAAFGAKTQASSALRQCLLGAMLTVWLLVLPFTGSLSLSLWLSVVACGTFARFRYIRFGELTLGLPTDFRVYTLAPLYLLLDQFMLAYTLIEWRLPRLRWRW